MSGKTNGGGSSRRLRPPGSLALLLIWLMAAPLAAILIRHDRDDARYRVAIRDYPQLVHLNTEEPGGPPDGEGTLIAPRWVATAAHVATLVAPGHQVTTIAGGREVVAVHLHPDWDGGAHDLALVELAAAVPGVAPARLYRGRDEAGRIVTVVGIGDTGTGLTGPAGNDGRLRAATNRIDEASEAWLKFVFDRGEDATDLEGISGPGDSGGPAFLETEDGRYLLLGVGSGQSTRATGGHEGLYGVTEYYTRISTHADWMVEIMGWAEANRPQGRLESCWEKTRCQSTLSSASFPAPES